jgi:hypothetical protein
MMGTLRPKFSASADLTITLANLASSTAGVGRQATLVDNSVTRYDIIHLYGKTTTGTSPTTGKGIRIYAIKGNGTLRTDGAGASDAAFTRVSAVLIKQIGTDATSDKTYTWEAVIANPGPEWGVAVVHDTAVNLKNAAGDQAISWIGEHIEDVA